MLTKQEIRQLGDREMMEELTRSRRELLKSQFDVRNGISKEVHMVKNLKHYIAQLQTIAKEMKMNLKPAGMGKAAPAAAMEEKKETEAETKAPVKSAPAKAKKAPAAKKTATKAPSKKPAAKSAKK